MAANHYTFDERALGLLGIAQSTGEMWIASEGGFIVKYLVTTTGNADYFGEGSGLINIHLPKDMTPPRVDRRWGG